MRRTLGLTAAVLMALVGVVWTLQGLGHLEGSPMTGSAAWAIIGPLVAGLGVALAIVVVQRGRGS